MKKQGFILVYTVLVLSLMLIVGGIFADTVLKEIAISRDEAESLKAFYAADAGVECMRYLKNTHDAFNTSKPRINMSCGVGPAFPTGGNPQTAACTDATYNITLSGFSNGSCAVITVNSKARVIDVAGVPTTICDAEIISSGRNRCSGGGKLVERTRWENI